MSLVALAVVLGLVQALTEFLPISSSAHLILARAALDFDAVDGLTFDIAVHIGTLLAIVVYFRDDLRALARGFLVSVARGNGASDPSGRLAWYVIVACAPAGLAGVFLEQLIVAYFRHPPVIIVTLIGGAVLFLWVERHFRHELAMRSLTLPRVVWIGLAQSLALIPGVSRSGITIAAGMMFGLSRDQAARFSFLLAAPLLLGAGITRALDRGGEPLAPNELTALAAGVVTSAIAGWLVVHFLLNYLRRHGLHAFAYYRIALAVVVLAVWLSYR